MSHWIDATVVGRYPQPDWLVDKERLQRRMKARNLTALPSGRRSAYTAPSG